MPLSPLSSVVPASVALLSQQQELLRSLQARAQSAGASAGYRGFFVTTAGAHGGGASIGQHLRHSTDHFVRFLQGVTASSSCCHLASSTAATVTTGAAAEAAADGSDFLVRYDARERGSDAVLQRERDPAVAAALLEELGEAIARLRDQDLRRTLRVSFVLSRGGDVETPFDSTVGRELAFCAHHAVHHNASIRQVAEGLGLEVPETFGFAPSTPISDA